MKSHHWLVAELCVSGRRPAPALLLLFQRRISLLVLTPCVPLENCFCFVSIKRERASLSLRTESTDIPPYVMKCPSNGLCSRLPADCIECRTNSSCVYGKPAAFDCTVKPSVTCVVSAAP